jgi:hypothetical protein
MCVIASPRAEACRDSRSMSRHSQHIAARRSLSRQSKQVDTVEACRDSRSMSRQSKHVVAPQHVETVAAQPRPASPRSRVQKLGQGSGHGVSRRISAVAAVAGFGPSSSFSGVKSFTRHVTAHLSGPRQSRAPASSSGVKSFSRHVTARHVLSQQVTQSRAAAAL